MKNTLSDSQPGAGRRFCSDRCRLLFWAAGELVKEFRAGRANALKELIQELKDESE